MEQESIFNPVFNMTFNLHKAYCDIGIVDDDVERMAAVYGMSVDEAKEAFAAFDKTNAESAAYLCEKLGNPTVTADKEIRLAMLGDSITSYKMSYRCIIKELLKDKENVKFGDFSISGYKVSDLFTAYYPFISDFAPNVATIMIGTNDCRMTDDGTGYTHTPIEHFKRDYLYLLGKLSDANCKCVAITLPPFCMKKMNVALDGYKILYKEDVLEAFNDVIIEAAKETGAKLVDMRDVYRKYDATDITIEDGLHLNPKGHRVLAENVWKVLLDIM